MVGNKNTLLRPPFSLRVPTSTDASSYACPDPTAHGSLLASASPAGGVSQETIRNSPLTPAANPASSVCQEFNANDQKLSSRVHIQPQLDSPRRDASSLLVSLPTISRDKDHQVFMVAEDIETYLKRDLDHSRLNKIHGLLWMAGRPLNARPIHRQKMLGFDFLLTEQADLHLLKFSTKLLIKPLPDYILDVTFWEKYLCDSEELHQSACGILLSYVWLICSPLDLKLAHKLDILPPGITWIWWKSFVEEFLSHVDANTLNQVNKRYHFGELRLGRINSIYRIRFFFTHFIRGYLYGYNRYVVFFQRNFAWILIVLVYFSLVLTAMQVGVTVSPLSTSFAFQQASYGFVVFSIVTVAAIVLFLGILYMGIFLVNMVLAISHDQQKRKDRETLAREGKARTVQA